MAPKLVQKEVDVGTFSVFLPGILALPKGARSFVVFAHGSGSSRFSPRNAQVAGVLHQAGIGTLLFDLLTSREDEDPDMRFDIDLLAERLIGAVDWLRERKRPEEFELAFFGASTGAAAALQASVRIPELKSVVSRGGRPDLAWDYLDRVTAPTLLIVGGRDEEVLELNRRALAKLSLGRGQKDLLVVPGATHLFEEEGAMEQVAAAARDWFLRFFSQR